MTEPAPEGIHYEDPRYHKWLAIHDILINDTPPALREVLKSSSGSLAARIVATAYPFADTGLRLRERAEEVRRLAGRGAPRTHEENIADICAVIEGAVNDALAWDRRAVAK